MVSSDSSSSLAAGVPVTLPRHIPDDLKLKILEYVFDFPHNDRPLRGRAFLLYKKCRVNPILKWPDWAPLVPEALYSTKKFALDVAYGGRADSGEIEQRIHYPKPHCAKFIKTAEIHFKRVEILGMGSTINMSSLILHFLEKEGDPKQIYTPTLGQ